MLDVRGQTDPEERKLYERKREVGFLSDSFGKSFHRVALTVIPCGVAGIVPATFPCFR
jgi:hypothetical protein